ncbi:MAG: choice-of-anchor Q domain-containing protein, partial [Bacteroidota bacterium]
MKNIFLFIGLFVFVAPLDGATYIVSVNTDSGVGSFRESITNANTNFGIDTVHFDPSINSFPIIIMNSSITVTEGIVLLGNGYENTIIDGAGANGTLLQIEIPDQEVHISGIRFSNFVNGVLNVDNGSIDLNNCYFDGNGNLDSTVGAITVTSSGESVISNSHFETNAAYHGGAINNKAGSLGVSSCSFFNNNALYGGAIFLENSETVIMNCFLRNNSSSFDGGAIYESSPSISTTISFCTITWNGTSLLGIGGGIYSEADQNFSMNNSLAFGNMDIQENDIYFENVSNGVYDRNIVGSCSGDFSNYCPNWFSNANPLFDLSNILTCGPSDTFEFPSLGFHSPAIDAGNPLVAPVLDICGQERSSLPDIGAHEFNPTSIPCENPYPQIDVADLDAQILPDGKLEFTWEPINGQIGCQINIVVGNGPQEASIIRGGPNVSNFIANPGLLVPGTVYQYRVRCGCSQNPLIVGPYSDFKTILYAPSVNIMENTIESVDYVKTWSDDHLWNNSSMLVSSDEVFYKLRNNQHV